MARILIHSATGPENPTRAALALLLARTAVEEGHEVQVFISRTKTRRRRRTGSEPVPSPSTLLLCTNAE
jgi:predicted peroxiredoxin